jgi:hypothetical protein
MNQVVWKLDTCGIGGEGCRLASMSEKISGPEKSVGLGEAEALGGRRGSRPVERVNEVGRQVFGASVSEPMLRFFDCREAVVPEGRRGMIEARYWDLAEAVTELLPRGPERTVALRKLLESRDCALRCLGEVPRETGGGDRIPVRVDNVNSGVVPEDI